MVKFARMQSLNLVKKYLIDSQVYVSVMGTALAAFFMLEQAIFRWPTLLLIFITFYSGYLYTKYQHHHYFGRILIFNMISGIVSIVLIMQNHNEIRLLKWLVIVALGLLYNSSFLDLYIRKIPLLKIFYVGLTWALINAWLILPEFNPVIFWINILFVTALILPFDIRDMKRDDVVTFPRLVGIQKTKYIAYLMISASCLLSIAGLKSDFAIAFAITCAVTAVLFNYSKPTNPDSYFSFWVETCSGLPLLFLVILKYF